MQMEVLTVSTISSMMQELFNFDQIRDAWLPGDFTDWPDAMHAVTEPASLPLACSSLRCWVHPWWWGATALRNRRAIDVILLGLSNGDHHHRRNRPLPPPI